MPDQKWTNEQLLLTIQEWFYWCKCILCYCICAWRKRCEAESLEYTRWRQWDAWLSQTTYRIYGSILCFSPILDDVRVPVSGVEWQERFFTPPSRTRACNRWHIAWTWTTWNHFSGVANRHGVWDSLFKIKVHVSRKKTCLIMIYVTMAIMALNSCTIDRLLLTTYFNTLPSKMVGAHTYTTAFFLFVFSKLSQWNLFSMELFCSDELALSFTF